jgi:hypothetical protein
MLVKLGLEREREREGEREPVFFGNTYWHIDDKLIDKFFSSDVPSQVVPGFSAVFLINK